MFSPVNTKKELVSSLGYEGFRLETSRKHVGAWNDSTLFEAVAGLDRFVLDYAPKGERRDWQGMWNAFCDWRGLERDK
jgi:hypothetical protein